jgi:glycosyltransferase involved in cell wall biosynthesis
MNLSKIRSEHSITSSVAGACSGSADAALVFVGAIVPEKPAFHTAAFSRSGQIYQREMLEGLRRAGLPVSEIISIIPMPSYPKSDRLWVGACREESIGGAEVRLLPFLNVSPVKQAMIGFFTVIELLRWGWRNRQAANRVVFTYNLTVPPGLFTLIGAQLIGAKAVVALCDIDVPGQTVPSGLVWRLNYWMQKRLIPLFDGHIVASEAIAQDFLAGRGYVRVEGGISEQSVSRTGDVIDQGKILDDPFRISFAGRIDETNGIPVLLEAFSLLEGGQYRLRIVGGGPLERQVLEAAVNDSRIEYLGFISFSEVLQLYKNSDVLVNMRITKGLDTKYFFPGKMMEYLVSGTPVITTCTGHTEEEFGEFVYLLRDETARGLAEIIRQVATLDPEVRRKLGQKAREYMALHKTWDAQAKNVAQFIRETVLRINAKPSTCQSGRQALEVEPQPQSIALRSQSVLTGRDNVAK